MSLLQWERKAEVDQDHADLLVPTVKIRDHADLLMPAVKMKEGDQQPRIMVAINSHQARTQRHGHTRSRNQILSIGMTGSRFSPGTSRKAQGTLIRLLISRTV